MSNLATTRLHVTIAAGALWFLLVFPPSATGTEPKSAATYGPPAKQEADKTESRQQPPKATKENASNATPQREKEQQRLGQRLLDFTLTDALIAIFTIVLAVVGKKQWDALKQQSKLLVALESPLIATLHEHGIKLVETDGPDGPAIPERDPIAAGPIPDCSRVVITVRNVGRSPAPISGCYIMWDIAKELPATITYRHYRFGVMLPVNSQHSFTPSGYPIMLTKEQRESIKAKTGFLWVTGAVQYLNLLKETVASPFCVRWDEARGFVEVWEWERQE